MFDSFSVLTFFLAAMETLFFLLIYPLGQHLPSVCVCLCCRHKFYSNESENTASETQWSKTLGAHRMMKLDNAKACRVFFVFLITKPVVLF
jgi:hypothetical protein